MRKYSVTTEAGVYMYVKVYVCYMSGDIEVSKELRASIEISAELFL